MFGVFKSWLLMLAILVMVPAANASSRIPIPASAKGPTQALINAHKSVKLLGCLQHKNGSVILPWEYDRLPDRVYYLPTKAKPVSCKVRSSSKNISPSPTIKSLEKQIVILGNNFEQLRRDFKELKAGQDKAQSDFAAKELKNSKRVSWWWLLVAFVLGGVVVFACQKVFGRPDAPMDINNNGKAEIFKGQHNYLQDRIDQLEKRWNDPASLRDRLNQLEAETTRRTTNSPSPPS